MAIKYNDADIPYAIYCAMLAETYSGTKATFSVTSLMDDPRIVWGMKRILQSGVHIPISDESIAFLGTVIHTGVETILKKESGFLDKVIDVIQDPNNNNKLVAIANIVKEVVAGRKASEFITETRLTVPVELYDGQPLEEMPTLTGEFDLYDKKNSILLDHKTMISGGWNMRHKKKGKWETQLNVYRILFEMHYGHAPSKLQVIGWITDWRKMRIMSDPLYPRSMWPVEDIEIKDKRVMIDFIKERMSFLLKYKDSDIQDMPYCSDENRWQNETTWKIIKLNKDGSNPAKPRAVPGGVFVEDEAGANAFLATKGKGYGIIHQKSDPTRCLEYCTLSQLGLCDYPEMYKSLNGVIEEVRAYDKSLEVEEAVTVITV